MNKIGSSGFSVETVSKTVKCVWCLVMGVSRWSGSAGRLLTPCPLRTVRTVSKHTAQAICVLPVHLLMAEIVDKLKVFVRLCSTFIFREDVVFLYFFPIE